MGAMDNMPTSYWLKDKWAGYSSEKRRWILIIFFGSVLIVSIALIAASFHSINENKLCLRYNVHDPKVERGVYEAGVHFGLEYEYICYPSDLQSIPFDGESNTRNTNPLTVRSVEGLEMTISVNVEYRLLPNEIFDLFTELGTEFEQTFIRIARSEIRNVAGQFTAISFLEAGRANISLAMTEQLDTAFRVRHAQALQVQIATVDLPDEFDAAVQAVTATRLELQRVIQERDVLVSEARRQNVSAVINIAADRDRILLTELSKIEEAKIARSGQIVSEETKAREALLQAQTSRENILVQARANIDRALASREGQLTAAKAEQDKRRVELETRLQQARAAAEARLIAANATAIVFVTAQTAELDALELEFDNIVAGLKGLRDTDPAEVTGTRLLQYRWMEALQVLNGTDFALDFKRVPTAVAGTS